MPIRWTELEPGSYEDLVAILLGILHPDIERVDGSGGDEGRDLFYQDAENLEIYQLKSYKDRLTSAQRSKVRKDLERAATHDPTAWILVVPIDPTPGERSWFDGLGETVSFPIHWRGLNWLEARMAENPQLVRYVSSDTNAEVIDLLKELREEEAALETAADAAPRVRRLVDRLNELDPYFTFRVESDGQITKLTATQRYADAVRDAQLGGTFSVTGDEAAHLLRGAVDYGLPAEFTAEHDVTVTMRAPGGLSYEGPVEHLVVRRGFGEVVGIRFTRADAGSGLLRTRITN